MQFIDIFLFSVCFSYPLIALAFSLPIYSIYILFQTDLFSRRSVSVMALWPLGSLFFICLYLRLHKECSVLYYALGYSPPLGLSQSGGLCILLSCRWEEGPEHRMFTPCPSSSPHCGILFLFPFLFFWFVWISLSCTWGCDLNQL